MKLMKNWIPLVFLLVAGVLYLSTAAISVQSGDTGELVTNSYFLRVSHPPGYPLWTLLYHLPTKILGPENPFHAASVFTILLSLSCLGLLVSQFRERSQVLLIGVLATSLVPWRYSVLPDVFALHGLFLTLVFIVFIRPDHLNKWWVILLLSLGVAHHHTILFVLPLFLFALWKHRGKRALSLSVVFGVSSLCFYLVLLSFNPEHYGSWDDLKEFGDVVNHFLRREYGTFRLQTRLESGGSWFEFFLNHAAMDAWSLFLALAYGCFSLKGTFRKQRAGILLLAGSVILYLGVFTFLAPISLGAEGEAVFERFLLQPLFLLFFLGLFLLKNLPASVPVWLTVFFTLNIGTNVFRNYHRVDYSKNTSVEDYLLNSLGLVPQGSIYYTYGDTIGFGTYYLNQVKNIRPDIVHIHPSWGFKWGPEKFNRTHPGVLLRSEENLFKSIDFKKHRFFTNYSVRSLPEGFDLTYLGPVCEISEGNGLVKFDCDQNYQWRIRPGIDSFDGFDIGKLYDLSYGNCFFAQGLSFVREKKLTAATEAFESALKASPFNARIQERLCFTLKALNDPRAKSCEERLDELLSSLDPQYVLQRYE